jgi:hypothetical protein
VSEDLIDWLRAHLDEDERVARTVQLRRPGPWQLDSEPWEAHAIGLLDSAGRSVAAVLGSYSAEFMATIDPARVLREVAAGRELLRIYEEARDYYRRNVQAPAGELTGLLTAIKLLAAGSFSDRPGYREEWRPQ